MTSASACGKVILLGEHAVVYGRPAIAVPISGLRATAEVHGRPEGGVLIEAHDLQVVSRLPGDEATSPLALTAANTLRHLGLDAAQLGLRIVVRSDVPIARGLGSGPAVATALVRALAQHLGRALSAEQVSALVYRTEVLLHGTPSGVDNTVVAHEAPVWYVMGQGPEFLLVGVQLNLVIGDTGVSASTREAVADVRRGWEANASRYERLFDAIEHIVGEARACLVEGRLGRLGELMDANQALLAKLGVSSAELDGLVATARAAGAFGAKLCGGGRGGCMVALVARGSQVQVAEALRVAGAVRVMTSTVVAHARGS